MTTDLSHHCVTRAPTHAVKCNSTDFKAMIIHILGVDTAISQTLVLEKRQSLKALILYVLCARAKSFSEGGVKTSSHFKHICL